MSVNDWSDEITSLDHLPAKLWHRANLPPTRSVPLTPLLVGTSADPRVACTARLHRPEPWTADRLSLRRREEERHSKKVKETSKNHVVVKRRFPPVPMSASVPGAMLGVTAVNARASARSRPTARSTTCAAASPATTRASRGATPTRCRSTSGTPSASPPQIPPSSPRVHRAALHPPRRGKSRGFTGIIFGR